jgi:hypothetical protein
VDVAFVGRRGRVRVAGIVLIGALTAGCAAGGYDAGSLRKRLEEAGLRPAQASCLLDRMVDRFGDNELNARVEPIAAEIRVERELLRRCGVDVTPPR